MYASRLFGVLVAVSLLSHAARADGKDDDDEEKGAEKISLKQLIKVAVQQSSTLAIARANRQKADLDKTIAGAPDQVQIEASLNVTRRAEDVIPNAQAQIINESSLASKFGFGKRIGTGGTLDVSITNTEQSRRYGVAPDSPAVANISVAQIGLYQPVLRGLGMGARVNEQKAELAASGATLEALDAGAQVVRSLIAGYWQLALARANLDVRMQSLKLSKEQNEIAKNLASKGIIAEVSYKSTSYGLALREEAVLRARRDLELGSIALRKLAGLELGVDQIELVPTDPITVEKPRKVDMDEQLEIALKNSPSIAAAKVGLDLANVVFDERKNGTLPSLDLSASAGGVGVGPGVGDSLSALGNFKSFQVGAGVSFRWEIGGAAQAAEDKARLDRATAKRQTKDIERDVISSVVQIVHDVRSAMARIEVTHKAIDLATANLNGELELFRAGKTPAVNILQRQTELEDAKLLEARAAVDYQIALTNLDYLTGKLLQRYGIELIEKSN